MSPGSAHEPEVEDEANRPGLVRRTLAYVADPAVPTWRKLVGGVAALYVIWPMDLVPDALPLLGWLDDLGVVGLFAWHMIRQINRHAATRARTPPPSPPDPGS